MRISMGIPLKHYNEPTTCDRTRMCKRTLGKWWSHGGSANKNTAEVSAVSPICGEFSRTQFAELYEHMGNWWFVGHWPTMGRNFIGIYWEYHKFGQLGGTHLSSLKPLKTCWFTIQAGVILGKLLIHHEILGPFFKRKTYYIKDHERLKSRAWSHHH